MSNNTDVYKILGIVGVGIAGIFSMRYAFRDGGFINNKYNARRFREHERNELRKDNRSREHVREGKNRFLREKGRSMGGYYNGGKKRSRHRRKRSMRKRSKRKRSRRRYY